MADGQLSLSLRQVRTREEPEGTSSRTVDSNSLSMHIFALHLFKPSSSCCPYLLPRTRTHYHLESAAFPSLNENLGATYSTTQTEAYSTDLSSERLWLESVRKKDALSPSTRRGRGEVIGTTPLDPMRPRYDEWMRNESTNIISTKDELPY